MKLLVVLGTRPEAIKLAPVIHEAARRRELQVKVCVTGQHQELLWQVLDFFRIKPDYNLEVMVANQTLSGLTARILDRIQPVLDAERPDFAIVQGDTTTAFAATLAAFYSRIPVGHVEAGLRTYNLSAPFPEEAMRQLTTRLASLHFAPTSLNRETLIKEGVPEANVLATGNTVVDAVLWGQRELESRSGSPLVSALCPAEIARVENSTRLLMVTGHRRESFGQGLENICDALAKIAQLHPEALIVYPIHPNPNVLGPVQERLGPLPNVLLAPPLEYPAFLYLMSKSYLIITDSGGVQEEAPSLGKPVLVTRDVTERVEAVQSGQVRLVGTDPRAIVHHANELLNSPTAYKQMSTGRNPYGDGQASSRIINALLSRGAIRRSEPT